jgi:polar amino acid transport system ATP-binding protein
LAVHHIGQACSATVEVANRVCFLAGGQIVEDSPPAELFTSPKDERRQRFLRRIIDAGRL